VESAQASSLYRSLDVRAKWAIATIVLIVLIVLVDLVFILLNVSGRRCWSSSS